MLVMLGFGSSARRGATGWTDRARVRWVIDTCQPDVTVDGASPSDLEERGADRIFYEEARAHFLRDGLSTDRATRCPMERALDGPGGVAFLRRNARMYRSRRPSVAAGWVTGRVGSPLSSGSAHMAGICQRGLDDVPPCPLVIFREDGVEPWTRAHGYQADLDAALWQMRALYALSRDEVLIPAGKALASFVKRAATAAEVVTALECAAEGSRWAPWIQPVTATVKAA